MFRYVMNVALIILLVTAVFHSSRADAADGGRLITETGSLLRGTVEKKSGALRSGVIAIRTKSGALSVSPVYQYDFDMLYCYVDGVKYSYLMGDVKEIAVRTPLEGGVQAFDMTLRNGALIPVTLTTERKPLLGAVDIAIEDVVVETDGYGKNIIPLSEIVRITFDIPAERRDPDMSEMVEDLGAALNMGARDGLIDEKLIIVLDRIQKRMKAKLINEKEKGIR